MFKVGDKVCKISGGEFSNGKLVATIGKIKGNLVEIRETGYTLGCGSIKLYEEELKMEKTFREVIATIKEGEVWDNTKEGKKLTTIRISPMFGTIVFEGNMSCVGNNVLCAIDPETKFKLRRKEYAFHEAFAAYEEGKEIESCINEEIFCKKSEHGRCDRLFNASQIRGNWYINE